MIFHKIARLDRFICHKIISFKNYRRETMPYISKNPEKLLGLSVGTGQCVAFVEKAAATPLTMYWKQGTKVKNNFLLKKGTAIATFQHGIYKNDINGLSHAAIYLRQTAKGIYVLDQWNHNGKRHHVSERLIKFKDHDSKPVNDGNAYYVIESK